MSIKYTQILFFVMAMIFISCESSKEEKQIKVSVEVEKKKTAQSIPANALAKVGDRYIMVSDYKKQLTRFSPKLAESESGRRRIINECVQYILIEKGAESHGLTKDPVIVFQIESYASNLYRQTLYKKLKEVQRPITEEEAKKYFQEHEENIIQPDRVRISILELDLNKKKEINALYKKLGAGKDFAKLAMEHSKHASAKRGGDLGFLTRKQYKPLTDVAFSLKPGKISKPFKSNSGWTIIKVTDFIKKQDISAEEGIKRAKARLEAMEASKVFNAFMKDLKEKNEVVIYEDSLRQITPSPKG